MSQYLNLLLFQISNEQYLRAAHIINEITAQNQQFLNFVKNTLSNRWLIINEIFSKQQR